MGLKFSNDPGPNSIPNRALTHLPKQAVYFLAHIFNVGFRTHHFPQTWKHARVISILKTAKDPALPSSYRPISLLDTIGEFVEKILLTKILNVVNKRGLMRDEQSGFRPCHITPLQLARLVQIKPGISVKRGSQAQFSSTWPKLRCRLDR